MTLSLKLGVRTLAALGGYYAEIRRECEATSMAPLIRSKRTLVTTAINRSLSSSRMAANSKPIDVPGLAWRTIASAVTGPSALIK